MSGALSAQPRDKATLTASQERRRRNEQSYLKKPISLRLLTKLAAAAGGQSAMPENLNTDFHFVAFVQALDAQDIGERQIVALDRRRSGPVDLGESKELLEASFLKLTTFISSNFVRRMLLASFKRST